MSEPARKTEQKPAPKADSKPAVQLAPQEETKAAKFIRLANRRVPKALKAIEVIGNLAVMSQYDFTPDQVQRILKVLDEAVALVRQRFSGTKAADKMFTL